MEDQVVIDAEIFLHSYDLSVSIQIQLWWKEEASFHSECHRPSVVVQMITIPHLGSLM